MRTKCSFLLVAATTAALLLAGCQSPDAGHHPQAVSPSAKSSPAGGEIAPSRLSVRILAAAFSNAGLSVRAHRSSGWSTLGAGTDFWTPSIGARRVEVFVFADASAAQKKASWVSAEQRWALVEWKGRTHLYARGRIIAFFVESRGRLAGQPPIEQDERVIEVLEDAMGPQFASV